MKNLFISMGDTINVRNFVAGSFTYREINASDVAALVEKTRSGGGRIRAYFEFGSVPSKKKQRDFRDLVAAFAKITGVQLTVEDFTTQTGEDCETLPNFNFIPTVTDDMSMVAVEYYFAQREGAKDIFEGFEVCDDSMNFHLFEKSA